MTTNPKHSPEPDRFQFSMRTLLIVLTVACLLFGFLEWVIPHDLPITMRFVIYVTISTMITYGAWTVYQAKRRPWRTPANYVNVKVDAKWKRRVESPVNFGPVAALTGVSLTFAPAYLLWCGQVADYGIVEWIVVPLCFLIIYFVPGFYMSLAAEVLAELRKSDISSN